MIFFTKPTTGSERLFRLHRTSTDSSRSSGSMALDARNQSTEHVCRERGCETRTDHACTVTWSTWFSDLVDHRSHVRRRQVLPKCQLSPCSARFQIRVGRRGPKHHLLHQNLSLQRRPIVHQSEINVPLCHIRPHIF